MDIPQTTVDAIVHTAHQLLELRGYNAWSYADIAATVGLRKASIHYHFPAKHDLVQHVVAQYRITAQALLAQIDQHSNDPRHKLGQYAEVTGSDGHTMPRLSLCALLAAETSTLPEGVRAEVEVFCNEQARWLQRVFEAGVVTGVLRGQQTAEVEAHLFFATLQGAVLLARVHNEPALYTLLAQHAVAAYALP
jgi:TetR/AcrR family transcriptional regulator, transcriptional repressor for nem operon